MEETVPFASLEYFVFLAALLFSRGVDFLSTRIATPTLLLEGNPIAKKMGWRIGAFANVLLCVGFAFYPLAATIVSTTSILVAARNFQHAWLMRTLGEEGYRSWYVARLVETHLGLYFFCLLAQAALFAALGAVLMYFSNHVIPFGIGIGVIGYAVTVVFYTSLAVWRIRR